MREFRADGAQGAGRAGNGKTEVDPWEALHQGLEREAIDSPSRYLLNQSSIMLPVRIPGVTNPGPAQTSMPRTPPPPVMPQAPAPRQSAPPAALQSTGAGPSTGRHRMLMRPYARTRGRTRPDYELALEALVSTSERGKRYEGAVSVQQRRICDLCCVATRSVAEIAAYLVLPLNVVKVLVSDMDNLGLVMIHQPTLTFGDRSSREFMARVLNGLRAL